MSGSLNKICRSSIWFNLFLMGFMCLNTKAAESAGLLLQETPEGFTIKCEGINYYIEKKPIATWSWQKYKFLYIGERDQKNSLGLIVNTDTAFGAFNAPMLTLPNSCVKSEVVKNSTSDICVRVEYPFNPVGKSESHPDFTVVVYFSFAKGVPGVALNYRLIAKNPVIITQFLSRFGNDFTSYEGEGKTKVEYTETQQTVVKFPWVIASKPGWNIMVSGSSNHCAEHGFLAGSSASPRNKAELEKGGVLEFTGIFGICDMPDDAKKLWDFRKSVNIPAETATVAP